jgi:hypothetical protein
LIETTGKEACEGDFSFLFSSRSILALPSNEA